jgi:hypothetical protein
MEESMKPLPRFSRNPTALSETCQRRLNSYALAATAAGVGALALAPSAEAKIVYTPAHVVMSSSGFQNYLLDLNHDGVADFSFIAYNETGMSSQFAFLRCNSRATNRVWGRTYEAALRPGVRIGSGGRYASHISMARVFTFRGGSGFRGPWANGGKGIKDGYLGLKFAIKGKTHYGWARLNVSVRAQDGVYISATLTGYAYETVPNKSIVAGRTKGPDVITLTPASLGHLAQGALGLSAWRRATPVIAP